MKKTTIQDVIDGLNEALNLLSKAGPNPICIDRDEYFERLHALQDKFPLEYDEYDQ